MLPSLPCAHCCCRRCRVLTVATFAAVCALLLITTTVLCVDLAYCCVLSGCGLVCPRVLDGHRTLQFTTRVLFAVAAKRLLMYSLNAASCRVLPCLPSVVDIVFPRVGFTINRCPCLNGLCFLGLVYPSVCDVMPDYPCDVIIALVPALEINSLIEQNCSLLVLS